MRKMRRFLPFASSRPGLQRFDPKAAVPACAPGTNMRAEDVTATLELALQASGLDQAEPATASV
jgi:hypothetical protein